MFRHGINHHVKASAKEEENKSKMKIKAEDLSLACFLVLSIGGILMSNADGAARRLGHEQELREQGFKKALRERNRAKHHRGSQRILGKWWLNPTRPKYRVFESRKG